MAIEVRIAVQIQFFSYLNLPSWNWFLYLAKFKPKYILSCHIIFCQINSFDIQLFFKKEFPQKISIDMKCQKFLIEAIKLPSRNFLNILLWHYSTNIILLHLKFDHVSPTHVNSCYSGNIMSLKLNASSPQQKNYLLFWVQA